MLGPLSVNREALRFRTRRPKDVRRSNPAIVQNVSCLDVPLLEVRIKGTQDQWVVYPISMVYRPWGSNYLIYLIYKYPKDHWTLKTGYFEDPTPATQVQNLPLEGPRSLG